jgi:ketosteroid isomerase-like protein
MRLLLSASMLSFAFAAGGATAHVPLRGAAAGVAATTAQTPLLSALREAERHLAEAVATRDVDALRTLIATDYYHVETNGRVRTRSEFMQVLARDEYEFRSYSNVSMEIQLLDSGHTAIVRGRLQADLQPIGGPREFRGRYVRIWQLQTDGWRNTMMQSTEIRPAR